MRLRSILLPLAAFGMAAAPVAASAAPAANPASSLSVARAASPSDKGSDLFGVANSTAGLFGLVIVAGIIAIIVIGATNKDKSTSP